MAIEGAKSLRDQLAEKVRGLGSTDEPQDEREPTEVAETTPEPQDAAEPEKTGSAPKSEARAAAAARRERDEAGKFAPTSQKADHKAEPQAQATEPAPRPAKPRPSSWKKDYEEHWGRLDPSLQDYITQREEEFRRGVAAYQTEAGRAKGILEAIAPHQDYLQQHGMQPEQIVGALLSADRALRTGAPQQKLQALAYLHQVYGIPLNALAPQQGGEGGEQQAQQYAQPDPHWTWAQQQIQQLNGRIQQFMTAQERQQQQAVQSEIARFSQGREEQVNEVRETMAAALQAGLAEDLESAFDVAIRHPKHAHIWEAMQEQQRAQSEAKRKEEAARQASAARAKAVSVKSATPTAPRTASAEGLRESLAEKVHAIASRRV